MSLRAKTISAIILILAGAFLLGSLPAAAETKPLIPCSGVEGIRTPGDTADLPACTTCHFFGLVTNIIDFVSKYLIPPIAVILISYAGLLYMLSGAVDQKAQAKSLLISTLLGVALTYSAFIILVTFLNVIVGESVAQSVFKITKDGFSITCEIPPPPKTSTDGSGGDGGLGGGPGQGTVSAEIQAAASRAATSGVKFDPSGDCGTGEYTVSPDRNIREVAGTGYQMTVCSSSCTDKTGCGASGGGYVTPSFAMLNAIPIINTLRGCAGYRATSIAGGRHGSGSRHYSGRAMDISVKDVGGTWAGCAQSIVDRQGSHKDIGFSFYQCESRGVQVSCSSGGIDHIHIEF
ncbi:MAG: pilin [bacterium]|nr:pilin [bacterium]MDZ4296201.1 pilin [Patescibacteria group bacterium]